MDRYKIAIIVGSLRTDSINRKVALSMCAMSHERSELRHRARSAICRSTTRNLDANAARGICPVSQGNRGGRRRALRALPNIIVAFPASSRMRSMSARGPMARTSGTRNRRPLSARRPAHRRVRRQPPAAPGGVFLNMPVMQHPEAYLGHVNDDSFDADGCLKDGPLKDFDHELVEAFDDWVHMIHRSRALLADSSLSQSLGKVTPRWPIYLPARSA